MLESISLSKLQPRCDIQPQINGSSWMLAGSLGYCEGQWLGNASWCQLAVSTLSNMQLHVMNE
jgi:hypothetical protein